MPLKLIVANKAYSSWSLRAWILLAHFKIPFEETVIPLDLPETHARILEHSPNGKVPALIDGPITVWESLSVIEYVAETHPGEGDLAARQGGAGACAFARRRDARRLSRRCARPVRPTSVRPVRKIALTERSRRTSRGSKRPGRMRARRSARPARSCSAASAPPTRCSRRSSTASTPTTFRFRATTRDYMVGGDGAAGVESLDRRRRGGRMAHRKVRRDLARLRWRWRRRCAAGRRARGCAPSAGGSIIADGLEHGFWTDFYHNAMTVSWPAFFAVARRRLSSPSMSSSPASMRSARTRSPTRGPATSPTCSSSASRRPRPSATATCIRRRCTATSSRRSKNFVGHGADRVDDRARPSPVSRARARG